MQVDVSATKAKFEALILQKYSAGSIETNQQFTKGLSNATNTAVSPLNTFQRLQEEIMVREISANPKLANIAQIAAHSGIEQRCCSIGMFVTSVGNQPDEVPEMKAYVDRHPMDKLQPFQTLEQRGKNYLVDMLHAGSSVLDATLYATGIGAGYDVVSGRFENVDSSKKEHFFGLSRRRKEDLTERNQR